MATQSRETSELVKKAGSPSTKTFRLYVNDLCSELSSIDREEFSGNITA